MQGTHTEERCLCSWLDAMPGTRGPVPVPLHDGTRDVTQQILDALEGEASLETATKFPNIPQAEIKAALDRLASRQMLQYTTNDREQVLLTPEGQTICDSGSHEYKVWDAVRKAGKLEMKELIVCGDMTALQGWTTVRLIDEIPVPSWRVCKSRTG